MTKRARLNPESTAETRTIDLLKRIHSGDVPAESIGFGDRCMLVSYLMSDGYSTAETAQVLKVSDRSVMRYKKALREANAISADPKLTEQMVGRLLGEYELCIQRIRRAARDKKAGPAVKIDAEYRCFLIVSELTQRMQGLGYLPTACQRIEADLVHHLGELPEFEDLKLEVVRIKGLTQQDGGDVPAELLQLGSDIAKAQLAAKVAKFTADAEQKLNENGGTDDIN